MYLEVANALQRAGYSDIAGASLSRFISKKNIVAVIAALPAIVAIQATVRLCIAVVDLKEKPGASGRAYMNDFLLQFRRIKMKNGLYYQMATLRECF